MIIDAAAVGYRELNEILAKGPGKYEIKNCLGQRFIGAGTDGKEIRIEGIPGNALGAYLNGSSIYVGGNAQDAVGDTMNDGKIIVNGNIGDAAGYAMRGGEIFVKGNAGYRAGIHMKEYKSKIPVMVIGGGTGSFLGEYQAGGIILVLGLNAPKIVGNFPCTGMHGGKVYLRTSGKDIVFPPQVSFHLSDGAERAEIGRLVERYCGYFGGDVKKIMDADFITVRPNSGNPYKQMYVSN